MSQLFGRTLEDEEGGEGEDAIDYFSFMMMVDPAAAPRYYGAMAGTNEAVSVYLSIYLSIYLFRLSIYLFRLSIYFVYPSLTYFRAKTTNARSLTFIIIYNEQVREAANDLRALILERSAETAEETALGSGTVMPPADGGKGSHRSV